MRVAAKATRTQTREQNRRFVLQCLMDETALSRADIARATGLTPPTVSDLLTGLVADGLVSEVGHGPSAGGKPPVMLSVERGARHVIAIDLSEGSFSGSVRDMAGRVVATAEVPDSIGTDALAAVTQLAGDLIARTDAPVLGIGVSSPGVVDAGVVREASNLGWHEVPLASHLGAHTGVPVHVVNDAQAAALAVFAASPAGSDTLVVKIARGLGAGIVLGGSLYRGEGLAAGEIGHVSFTGTGQPCGCGNHGCLETTTSLVALLGRLSPHTGEGSAEEVLDRTVHLLAEGDDADRRAVTGVIDTFVDDLAPALAFLVGGLDITSVAIAGEVWRLGEPLLAALGAATRLRIFPSIARRLTMRYVGNSDASADGVARLVVSAELGVL